MKKLTIKDVAREANVCVATVSRVLNGNATVAQSIRENVLGTIDRLGYIPDANARNVKKKTSDLLCVLLPTIEIPVFSTALQGILDTAVEYGLRVCVYCSRGCGGRDANYLKDIIANKPAGLIYCPPSKCRGNLDELIKQEIPLVIALRKGLLENAPHVYMDDYGGGYKATKYLLQQGHKRIAFFSGFWETTVKSIDEIVALLDDETRGSYSSLERLAGYKAALLEYNIPFDKSLIAVTKFDSDTGYKTTKEFLSKFIEFDGVLCGNDLVASGAIKALREQNIAVPEKVSVVGYDDSELAEIFSPSLTSVRQDGFEIGKKCVEAIVAQQNKKKAGNTKLEVTLALRQSTSSKN